MTEQRERPRLIFYDDLKGAVADITAGAVSGFIALENVRPGSDRCTASRDLFAGTPEAGTVLQFCELEHHTSNLAHRMTNPDGSATTWRR